MPASKLSLPGGNVAGTVDMLGVLPADLLDKHEKGILLEKRFGGIE